MPYMHEVVGHVSIDQNRTNYFTKGHVTNTTLVKSSRNINFPTEPQSMFHVEPVNTYMHVHGTILEPKAFYM